MGDRTTCNLYLYGDLKQVSPQHLDELIEAINKGKETSEIKKIAMRGGMKTLHQDSLLKVKDGITTLPEALATVPVDMT